LIKERTGLEYQEAVAQKGLTEVLQIVQEEMKKSGGTLDDYIKGSRNLQPLLLLMRDNMKDVAKAQAEITDAMEKGDKAQTAIARRGTTALEEWNATVKDMKSSAIYLGEALHPVVTALHWVAELVRAVMISLQTGVRLVSLQFQQWATGLTMLMEARKGNWANVREQHKQLMSDYAELKKQIDAEMYKKTPEETNKRLDGIKSEVKLNLDNAGALGKVNSERKAGQVFSLQESVNMLQRAHAASVVTPREQLPFGAGSRPIPTFPATHRDSSVKLAPEAMTLLRKIAENTQEQAGTPVLGR
jgi:hypothetical protein